MAYLCPGCRLPDPDSGEGDGTNTCNCDRCVYCDAGPQQCDCEDDGDTRTRDNDWAIEVAY